MTTVVDLHNIGKDENDRRKALQWLFNNYGPADGSRWDIEELTRVKFQHDKDATYFSLRWS